MATILVIEDDVDIAALIGLRMTMDGHRAELVYDGAAAVTAARELHPDVVILDWTLPGLSGPEVVQALRADPETAGVWVLLLTARPLTGVQADEVGADELVPKPFSPRELSRRVAAALRRAT